MLPLSRRTMEVNGLKLLHRKELNFGVLASFSGRRCYSRLRRLLPLCHDDMSDRFLSA